jgi:hypothetical protein
MPTLKLKKIFMIFLEATIKVYTSGDGAGFGQSSFGTLQNKYITFVASSLRDILKLCVTYLSQKPLSETRWECRIESVKCV